MCDVNIVFIVFSLCRFRFNFSVKYVNLGQCSILTTLFSIIDLNFFYKTELCGLGKTHIGAAIGHALLEQSIRVKFTTSTALVQELQKARAELSLEDALKKLDKYELLTLDDIGYVKKSDSESQVLFELIAYRYERNSLLITTNQAFKK
jgi:chromosomal replication initiation ATPase DnaA